jgi:NADPH2:quinone reductase
MKAAYIEQTGPPENLRVGELPKPTPTPGQVLVRVRAASVNPVDTYVRAGMVAVNLPMPFIVGCDFAGEIEAVGSGVTAFQPGDRVWGSNQGLLGRQGTFCEYVAVDECFVYPMAKSASFQEAAALALVGITAHLGLVRDARLQPGETIFVNGGSGGVGSTVVRMAKILGARVICTAGSAEKVDYCKRLGADVVIQYREEDVMAVLRREAPTGVQVWWETLREPDFDRVVAGLAPRGRMILMAGREARPAFPVGPFYVKGLSLHGFAMFNATPREQQSAASAINQWFQSEGLRARIGRVYPLDQVAEAHHLQESSTLHKSGTLFGKIVIEVPG